MPTPVTLTLNDTPLSATLNDSVTARALAEILPFSCTVSRYENDYCGPVDDLPLDRMELRDGWTDGDIGYGQGYFSILFSGQEISEVYTDMMIVGRLDEGELAKVRAMGPELTVTLAADARG